MILVPFESSHQDGTNDTKIAKFKLPDNEISRFEQILENVE